MNFIAQFKKLFSKPFKSISTIWKKIIYRAESCPKCGSRVCLISNRIFGPRSKFICPSCGCISCTPLFAYLVPIILTSAKLFFEIMEDLNSVWGINYKHLTYDGILVYSLSTLCSLIIIPLKKKPDTAKRRKILRQRAKPTHHTFVTALYDIGKRMGAHLPPRLRAYVRHCGAEAMKQVHANLSCPNCGKQVVSARKRILHGLFLSGTCPYCATGYKGGLIAPISSAAIGIFVYLNLAVFVETIPFLPQIVLDMISLFVVLPLCLLISYCVVGALGILVSPLKETESSF